MSGGHGVPRNCNNHSVNILTTVLTKVDGGDEKVHGPRCQGMVLDEKNMCFFIWATCAAHSEVRQKFRKKARK